MTAVDILEGYNADAAALCERYDAISTPEFLAPVIDVVPAVPSQILDIGAGSGRDAGWFAAQGHQVVAVEPAGAMRRLAKQHHAHPSITWEDDSLPKLARIGAQNQTYDLILILGVWHHLSDPQRIVAMPNLFRLTASGGHVILSLRHGPGALSRPSFACDTNDTVGLATDAGFSLVRKGRVGSRQRANRVLGVVWDWLVLTRH